MDKAVEKFDRCRPPSLTNMTSLPVKAAELSLAARLNSLSLKQTSSPPVLVPSCYKNTYHIGDVLGMFYEPSLSNIWLLYEISLTFIDGLSVLTDALLFYIPTDIMCVRVYCKPVHTHPSALPV